jgi:flagellar hook-length control protein FliK
MGLVAFSPIDTLFAPPGEGAGKHGSANGLSGGFTDLLAALLGTAAGESGDVAASQAGGEESVDNLLALLTAGHGKANDDAKGMPAMAALLASLLHPAAIPVDVSLAVKGREESGAAAAAGAVTPTVPSEPAAAGLAVPTAGEAETEAMTAQAPANDTALAADDGPAPSAVDTAPPATAPVSRADGLAAETSTATSTDATTPPVATAFPTVATAAQATGQADAPPDDGPVEAKATDRPDTSGPPETVTVQQGVVRFVGNAQKGKHEGQQDGPGLPDHERGVPRASAQGIAHASDNSAVAQLRTPAPDTPPVDQIAPPPPPAEQPQPVEQVAQAVIEKLEDGGGEAHIRLDPPDLGEVTIHVKISGGHVRVDVHAERTETMQLLRDQALDLTSLLHGRGLDLTDVYVGLGGRQAPDAGDDEGSGGRQGQGRGDEFAALLGVDEEPPASDRYNRLRAVYNPDGSHVYRI